MCLYVSSYPREQSFRKYSLLVYLQFYLAKKITTKVSHLLYQGLERPIPDEALLKSKVMFSEHTLFKLLHFRFIFSAKREGELHLLFPSFSLGIRGRPDSIHKDSTFQWVNWFHHYKMRLKQEGRKTFPSGILKFSIAILLSYTVQLYSSCHSKLATKILQNNKFMLHNLHIFQTSKLHENYQKCKGSSVLTQQFCMIRSQSFFNNNQKKAAV